METEQPGREPGIAGAGSKPGCCQEEPQGPPSAVPLANSDGQDTTVQGLDGPGNGVSQDPTPSSSPNSSNQASRAGVSGQHTSSSGHTSLVCPPAQLPSGPYGSEGNQSQQRLSSIRQLAQQLQANSTTLPHHQGPPAAGADSVGMPVQPAAQSPLQLMQQPQQQQRLGGSSSPGEQQPLQPLSGAADDEAATGEDMDDEFPEDEQGSPQSEVGLELLGAVAAAEGPAHGATAAAAGQAQDEGAAGAQPTSSAGTQKGKAKGGAGGAGAAASGASLVCQVPDCGVPLTGTHVSPYFRRHRVCVAHAKADTVNMHGRNYRFCQQCGVLHPIGDFDGQRKSCRVQLDKHNLRRRCRRKSQTKSSNASYYQEHPGRVMPVAMMGMDPYGGLAQAYGMHPGMGWGALQAGLQATVPKRGSAVWGRGVSEDTGEMSRDRDEASNWHGDAADSGQHAGFAQAWGFGAGVPYDAAGMYAAGMVAGPLPHMMQQQPAAAAAASAAMQGAGAQEGWGMQPGGELAAAAAAGWGAAAAAAAPPAGAAAGYGAADSSYTAALAAAAAAANCLNPPGGAAAAHPVGAGSNGSKSAVPAAAAAAPSAAGVSPEQLVASLAQQLDAAVGQQKQQQHEVKHEEHSARSSQQRPGPSGHAGAMDPAAAAAVYMPESHSGADHAAAAAAAGVSRPAPPSSGGGISNTAAAAAKGDLGLQQLRLYIAAAIAGGKGPGLRGLRDMGFVQQLLIVDELAHGMLAEMQKEQQQQQDSGSHQQQGPAQVPQPAASVGGPAAPVSHGRPASGAPAAQEQQEQQRPKEQVAHSQRAPAQQQQHQPSRLAPSQVPTMQQQQQAAMGPSPPKADPRGPGAPGPGAPSAAAAPAAVAAAAGPGGVPALTDVPPVALAALMEQIAKYATNPGAAAPTSQQQPKQGGEQQPPNRRPAAAPGSSNPAAAAADGAAAAQHVRASSHGPPAAAGAPPASTAPPAAAAAWQPGSSGQQVSGIKRESTEFEAEPASKRPKSADPTLPRAVTPGADNAQQPSGPAAVAPAATKAPVGAAAPQRPGPTNSAGAPHSQQQQRRTSPAPQQPQLQQQLQGLLGRQSGGGQAAQMLSSLLQQLTAAASNKAPQQ